MEALTQIQQSLLRADGVKTYVLSHARCFDGDAAAFAAWHRLRDAAEYHFLSYGDALPEIEDGSIVYILDYSRPFGEILNLAERGCRVILLDHHESAMLDLVRYFSDWDKDVLSRLDTEGGDFTFAASLPFQQLVNATADQLEDFVEADSLTSLTFTAPNIHLYFDLGHSGANLSWRFFQSDLEIPDLIRYVEDRDLWVWRLPESEEVSEALWQTLVEANVVKLNALLPGQDSTLRKFQFFADLCRQPDYVERLAEKGRPLVVERRKIVNDFAIQAMFVEVQGYSVPIAPAPRFYSWVGHELCQRYPDAPFAVMWRDHDEGIRNWDLRSRKFNTRRHVAEPLQGGGHRKASGFRTYQVWKLEPGDRFRWFDENFIHADQDRDGNPLQTWQVLSKDRIQCLNDPNRRIQPIDDSNRNQWVIKLKTF